MKREKQLAVLKKMYLVFKNEKQISKKFDKEEMEYIKEILSENYEILYKDIAMKNGDEVSYVDEKNRYISIPEGIDDDFVFVHEQLDQKKNNEMVWYEDKNFLSGKN